MSTLSFQIIAHAQNQIKPLVALIGQHLDQAIGLDPWAIPGATCLQLVRELSLHVCLSGQFPCFPVSRRKTTTTKILTYFSNNGAVPVVIDCFPHDPSQIWTFNNSSGTLSAYDGKMCLDVKDGTGVAFQLLECVPGSDNQKWGSFFHNALSWLNHNRCLERTNPITVEFRDCNECVEASNVCLITDSRKPGARRTRARFRSSFLCCERLILVVLLEWVQSFLSA